MSNLQPTPSSNPSSSRLLALPPELRNRIWELAVIFDAPIDITPAPSHGQHRTTNPPGIFQTSRQTRAESLPMYLSQNTFRIGLHTQHRPGFLALYIGETRSLEFSICHDGCRCRLTRDGEWAAAVIWAETDAASGSCRAVETVAQNVRSWLKHARAVNADGRVTRDDLWRLVRRIGRWNARVDR